VVLCRCSTNNLHWDCRPGGLLFCGDRGFNASIVGQYLLILDCGNAIRGLKQLSCSVGIVDESKVVHDDGSLAMSLSCKRLRKRMLHSTVVHVDVVLQLFELLLCGLNIFEHDPDEPNEIELPLQDHVVCGQINALEN